MTFEEKQRELSKLSDRQLVERVLAFPDRNKLDYQKDSIHTIRCFAMSAAENAKERMDKDPDRGLSAKERYGIINSFAVHSTTEVRISGTRLIETGPDIVQKEPVGTDKNAALYKVPLHIRIAKDSMGKPVLNVYANRKEGAWAEVGWINEKYRQKYSLEHGMDMDGIMRAYPDGTVSYTIGQDLEMADAHNLSAGIRPRAYGEKVSSLDDELARASEDEFAKAVGNIPMETHGQEL